MLLLKNPISQYFEVDGTPLDDGDVFIGTAGLNAEANPINLYWDKEGLTAAPNPLPTSNGYIVSTGTPARVFINDLDYSIIVKNKIGETVYSTLSVTGETIGALSGSTGAANIGYDNDTSGLTAENVQDALDEIVSDLSGFVDKTGDTMSGALNVPAGATGTEVPQVQEVVGKTSSIGSAKLPAGTTVQRDASPTVGFTRWNSDLTTLETGDGSLWIPARSLKSAAVPLTGASVDFAGVPSWISELDIAVDRASLSGSDAGIICQLNTASGLVTSGYLSTSASTDSSGVAAINSTAGFILRLGSSLSNTFTGVLSLKRVGSAWISSHTGRLQSVANAGTYGGGAVDVAVEITGFRIKASGSNNLDSGNFVVFMRS